jgi:hypothetical protein
MRPTAPAGGDQEAEDVAMHCHEDEQQSAGGKGGAAGRGRVAVGGGAEHGIPDQH